MTIDIPRLLEIAGGEVVGKVRLQKAVYLLDQLGMNSGFSYDYHHYGPFSADLADQLDEDVVFGRVIEVPMRRASDGVPFSAYRAGKSDSKNSDKLGDVAVEMVKAALTVMQQRSATILELAATIHWLRSVEGIDDWRSELLSRKGAKTENGRADKALDLLKELGLAPR